MSKPKSPSVKFRLRNQRTLAEMREAVQKKKAIREEKAQVTTSANHILSRLGLGKLRRFGIVIKNPGAVIEAEQAIHKAKQDAKSKTSILKQVIGTTLEMVNEYTRIIDNRTRDINELIKKFRKNSESFKSEKDFLKQVIAKAEQRRSFRKWVSIIRNESKMSLPFFKKKGLLDELESLVRKEMGRKTFPEKERTFAEIGSIAIQRMIKKIKEALEEDKRILEQTKDDMQKKGQEVSADFEKRIVLAGQKAEYLSEFTNPGDLSKVKAIRKRIYSERLRSGRETRIDIEESALGKKK